MRIPDPKPAPLTERARVLREIRALEAPAVKVRTKAPWRQNRLPDVPSAEMKADLGLVEAIDNAVLMGRRMLAKLEVGRRDMFRPSRDVLFFMDLAFAVKLDFSQCMREANNWFPI